MRSWGGVAEAYRDSFGRLCEGTVSRLVDDTPGDAHLDVGCGTGALAAEASSRGRSVLAVDADAAMVAMGSALLPGRVLQASLPHLPVGDDEFDAVTANFVVNHVSNPLAAMRELRRVARPGGWVAVTIWPAGGSDWAALVTQAFDVAGFVTTPSERLSPELDFERSVDGLRDLTERAELDVVEATELRWVWEVSPEQLWRGVSGGVATPGQRYLAQTRQAQHAADAAFHEAAARVAQDGLLRFATTAAYVLATA